MKNKILREEKEWVDWVGDVEKRLQAIELWQIKAKKEIEAYVSKIDNVFGEAIPVIEKFSERIEALEKIKNKVTYCFSDFCDKCKELHEDCKCSIDKEFNRQFTKKILKQKADELIEWGISEQKNNNIYKKSTDELNEDWIDKIIKHLGGTDVREVLEEKK